MYGVRSGNSVTNLKKFQCSTLSSFNEYGKTVVPKWALTQQRITNFDSKGHGIGWEKNELNRNTLSKTYIKINFMSFYYKLELSV